MKTIFIPINNQDWGEHGLDTVRFMSFLVEGNTFGLIQVRLVSD